MAKRKQAAPKTKSTADISDFLTLKGKSFCFGGRWGKYEKQTVVEQIQLRGGTIAKEVTENVDYVVVHSSKAGTTSSQEKKAAKINNAGETSIMTIDETAVEAMISPDSNEIQQMLKTPGTAKLLSDLLDKTDAGASIELNGLNLDGLNMDNIRFNRWHFHNNLVMNHVSAKKSSIKEAVIPDLADCDFRECNAEGSDFSKCQRSDLSKARLSKSVIHLADASNFDHADLSESTLSDLKNSSFRSANLRKCRYSAYSFYRRTQKPATPQPCDFSKADLSNVEFSAAELAQSSFVGATLKNAELSESDLSGCDFTGADLSGADLSRANLSGAILDRANLNGAKLRGTNLDGAKTDKAKGLKLPKRLTTTVGPRMKELDKLSKKAVGIKTSATVYVEGGQVELCLEKSNNHITMRWEQTMENGDTDRYHDYTWKKSKLSDELLNLAHQWSDAELRFDTITVGSSKSPIKGAELKKLLVDCWCEAYGVEQPSEEELKNAKKSRDTSEKKTRDELLEELANSGGVTKFNKRDNEEVLKAGHFRKANFANTKLAGVKFPPMEFNGANFEGATLKKARFAECKCGQCNFKNADLNGANFKHASLTSADFSGAKLAKANLQGAALSRAKFIDADLTDVNFNRMNLSATDLTGANLSGASFTKVIFNDDTKFPKDFKYQDTMVWAGKGPNPMLLTKKQAKEGSLTIEQFMAKLKNTADQSKLAKATKMLKADRFELFVQQDDGHLTGVVKSQSDSTLVYSCRLKSDGAFCCCTQNLNVCGGLRGSLCKHLLVLIVGLAQNGEIDAATVHNWVTLSTAHKPNLDKDAMSETFLKYKGAEAGEIDWRPTETVPEDFYAL